MIQLIDVTIGYNKQPLKSHINMTFDKKIYAILGESGIGKSTLLKTIAGLIYPIKGKVELNNEQIYMMHQHYSNFPWMNCVDNILIAKSLHKNLTRQDKEEALMMLDSVGLKDSWNKYPLQLSGGMNQRLALARTLFAKPQVLLMDEPLSALDENTRVKMQNLVLAQHFELNNTIILITHSREEAKRMGDVIIRMEDL